MVFWWAGSLLFSTVSHRISISSTTSSCLTPRAHSACAIIHLTQPLGLRLPTSAHNLRSYTSLCILQKASPHWRRSFSVFECAFFILKRKAAHAPSIPSSHYFWHFSLLYRFDRSCCSLIVFFLYVLSFVPFLFFGLSLLVFSLLTIFILGKGAYFIIFICL